MTIAMIGQKGIPAAGGGVERHVHDLSRRLASRDHDVIVYARPWYSPSQEAVVDGAQVVYKPSIETKHLDTISHVFVSTIDAIEKGVDVIHYHGVGPALLSWIPRLFAKDTRVVTTFHSIDRMHKKWNWMARTILRFGEWAACAFAHETIAVSTTIKQYASKSYGGNLTYIPNAVEFPPVHGDGCDLLKEYGLDSKEYVLMVSRLIPHKGAHYLIRAWQMLKQIAPETVAGKKLVIAGGGHHTEEYENTLHAMTFNDNDIIFTGMITGDKIHELLSHAYAQVHPSDNEGMPIVVLEGMSHGLPVLLSDIDEHRMVMPNSSFWFRQGQVKDLTEKMNMLLTLSTEQQTSIGVKNAALIARDYSWDRVIERIEEVYTSSVEQLPIAESVVA